MKRKLFDRYQKKETFSLKYSNLARLRVYAPPSRPGRKAALCLILQTFLILRKKSKVVKLNHQINFLNQHPLSIFSKKKSEKN